MADLENYPFATLDGTAIPLDIIKGKGFIRKNITASTKSTIAIPAGSEVAMVQSTADCILFLDDAESAGAIVSGTFYPNAIFIPRGLAITITLKEATASVLGFTEAGILTIQFIEKWAGLSLPTTYTTRG